MSNEPGPERDAVQPRVYQIRIKGHLGHQWTDWFEGLTITLEEDGDTLLTGTVIDQAALHGLLKKVRDLGMPLLLVNSAEASQTCQMPNHEAHPYPSIKNRRASDLYHELSCVA
jgi:hypothetical protein